MRRQGWKDVIDAFLNSQDAKYRDTLRSHAGELTLYNSVIAKYEDGAVLIIVPDGWNTKTTRDVLNMFPDIHVTYRKGRLAIDSTLSGFEDFETQPGVWVKLGWLDPSRTFWRVSQ